MNPEMPNNTIADLAVLGILHNGPMSVDRLAPVLKALMPEFWQPTHEVIEVTVFRNLDCGYLQQTIYGKEKNCLTVTPTGAERIRVLLRADPGSHISSAALATEAIQFCFLDIADRNTVAAVLQRLMLRFDKRRASLEDRYRRCPYHGRYKNLWIGMELRRLERMIDDLSAISANPAVDFINTRITTGPVP